MSNHNVNKLKKNCVKEYWTEMWEKEVCLFLKYFDSKQSDCSKIKTKLKSYSILFVKQVKYQINLVGVLN
jgi:hypothetical protein